MGKRQLMVMTSDATSRYGTRIVLGALHREVLAKWRAGLPMLISHDAHRLLGWSWPLGIHLEPGLGRVVGVNQAAAREEWDDLVAAYENYMARITEEEAAPHLPRLHELLTRYLDGSERATCRPAVALVGDGLARRAFQSLFEVEDKDGLVKHSELTPIGPGVYQVGELALFAHPYFRRNLSRFNNLNDDLLAHLAQEEEVHPGTVRIRLDPDAVALAASYAGTIEWQYWYGPRFSDDISKIPTGVTRHEADEQQRLFHGVSRTEFWWQSRADKQLGVGQHILEIEELRDAPTAGNLRPGFGCRYVHCIVDEPTNAIRHLDGAVREYGEEAMVVRLDTDIVHAGRQTEYTKLWRVDGAIALPTMKSLVGHHFRDNPLVGEYLGTAEPQVETRAAVDEPVSPVQRLVPYSMAPGDGVRLMLSYWGVVEGPSPLRVIRPSEYLGTPEDSTPCFDAAVVELRKLLRRDGATLDLPAQAQTIVHQDLYVGFPLIQHADRDALAATLKAYRTLLQVWQQLEHDRVISLNLGVRDGDHEVRLAMMGHVADLAAWLGTEEPFPPTGAEPQTQWVEMASAALRRFPAAHDRPSLATALTLGGELRFDRQALPRSEFELIHDKQQRGLRFKLRLPPDQHDVAAAIAAGRLTVKLAIVLRRTRCTRCKRAYPSCPCIKFVDSGVGQVVEKMEFAYAYWTDRPV